VEPDPDPKLFAKAKPDPEKKNRSGFLEELNLHYKLIIPLLNYLILWIKFVKHEFCNSIETLRQR
jgi:hypothetical protein